MPAKKAPQTKAKKSVKGSPKKKEDKQPDPPVVVEEKAVEPVEVDAGPVLLDYSSEIENIRVKVKSIQSLLKDTLGELTTLEKRCNRERKFAEKKMKGRTRNSGNAKNGFSKPGPVSDELRGFLGIGADDLIARVDVTKAITKYCQENKLQNEADKRILLPDTTLLKLLKINKKTELTYFNLQKYLKIHFPNKEGVYPTPVAV